MAEPEKTPSNPGGVSPQPRPEIEVGVSHYLPFITPFRNSWEILRDDDITVKQLVAMRRTDGQARALYRLITLPIRSALKGATFVPEDHVDGGEDEAAFIEQLFNLPSNAGGMMTPFSRVIAQMLLAVFDGFSAFEMVYWAPKTGPLKGKWTLKKLAHRPAETLTFLIGKNSEFAGFRQQSIVRGVPLDVEIPGEHCVYYASNEEERPFYGRSFFEAAFAHWDKKFRLYTIAHIAAQRAAVGTRIGKMPNNPAKEDRERFVKALADLGVAQYMAIPETYTVDSLKETAGFDFLAMINHHNSQMSKSVLASFFDKEQGGGDSGKLVDFGTQSDALFMLMLQTIMSEIEEIVNQQIIPRFIDWNFGSQKYPRFQFGSLSQEQKQSMMDLFSKLAVAGQSLTIRPEFVHELEVQAAEHLGLELDWETIEEEMAVEKEMAEQQQQMQLEQQMAGAQGGGEGGTEVPEVDPSILPSGFTLSNVDQAEVALTDLARDLLAEAYDELSLTRGVPTAGGPKKVQTQAGAKVYGVPIGHPITRDVAERQGKREGVKGGPLGHTRGKSKAKPKSQQLGGGPGAPAQNPGGVVTDPDSGLTPKRVFTHPEHPGVELLDFGDGTVAIRDAQGRISRRQRFNTAEFAKLGWVVSDPDAGEKAAADREKAAKKPAAKKTAKKAEPEKK